MTEAQKNCLIRKSILILIYMSASIKSWWDGGGNLLSLVSAGGYYFKGFL